MVGGWQRIRDKVGGLTLTLLVLALLAATVHVVVFQGERREAVVLSERLNRVRQDIGRLARENERLRHLIVNIRQTDDQVEKIGREDFGYIRSGEILYYFEPQRPKAPEKPAATPKTKVTPRPAGIIPQELSDQLKP